MLQKFPVVSLTGPRQSGKTTLLTTAFSNYKYVNLERFDVREILQNDPIGFLNNAGEKVVFDEAQHFPELFSYIQVVSDERGTNGQYILSGSQNFLMSRYISQSLAGRVSIQHLYPFNFDEIDDYVHSTSIPQLILNGFFPRLFNNTMAPTDYYPSYLQTYIERDIGATKAVTDINSFSRFLALCAGRTGQVLNISSLASDAGIAVNTAKAWLSLLESSFVIFLLPPYYKNFNKRIIKSPKLYFIDTGLVMSLLKVNRIEDVYTHYLFGSLFENLVIAEIFKQYSHCGLRPSLFYWRDSNGVEIDCIIEHSATEISAIEIKAGETFNSFFLKNLKMLPESDKNLTVKKYCLYTGEMTTVTERIEVINWKAFCNKEKRDLILQTQ